MNEHVREQLEIMNQQIKELSAVYHSAASSTGISENEFWIWYALLLTEERYSQQDICDMWSLPKQTVNTIIINLSKKGYVQLEAIAGTRNRKIICLTEEGERYGEKIVNRIYEAEQRSFEKMTEQERKSCIALLRKYTAFLKEEVHEK